LLFFLGGKALGTIRQRSTIDRFWHAILDRSFGDVPRPTDAPFAHTTGCDPHRVLVFGSGTAVGWGVRSHQLALPGQLARELGERTPRGVDVDLIADRRMTVLSAVDALAGRLIEPYDAVVLSIGMTDSLRFLRPSLFRRRMRTLLGVLSSRTSPSARLILLGMQPIETIPFVDSHCGGARDAHARRLDRVLKELAEEFPKSTYVGMSAPAVPAAEGSATADDYRLWAHEIALCLAPALTEATARSAISGPVADAELARQHARRELEQLDIADESRFSRIADLARSMFGVSAATISLLDGDRHWMIAASGMERLEMPYRRSLSQHTMGCRAAFVVPDLQADPQLRDTQAAALGLRFYAGYPIKSPSGQTVGALAVLDAEAHPVDWLDAELLRDLAMVAQHELWAPQPVSAS
jgi:lysophospholipase L1-like esterase